MWARNNARTILQEYDGGDSGDWSSVSYQWIYNGFSSLCIPDSDSLVIWHTHEPKNLDEEIRDVFQIKSTEFLGVDVSCLDKCIEVVSDVDEKK